MIKVGEIVIYLVILFLVLCSHSNISVASPNMEHPLQ